MSDIFISDMGHFSNEKCIVKNEVKAYFREIKMI